jgi:hypothetical protein
MAFGKFCYVLGHDLGWKIVETLPDGRETGIVRHESTAALLGAIATDPRGIHCLACEDAGEVIEVGITISRTSLDANEGTRGTPTVVLIDEAVSAGDADPYRLGGPLKKAMALRRHHNLGIIWTCQSPNLCHYQMMAIGTELVCFRLTHEKDLNKLRDVGLNEKQIQTIKQLPDHHYLIHKFG